MSLNIAKTPAFDAFVQNDPQASKDFHNKVYDEPHKTNSIKKAFLKHLELGLISAVCGITISLCVVGGLAGLKNSSPSFMDTISKKFNINEENYVPLIFTIINYLQTILLTAVGLTLGYLEYIKKEEYKSFYESERRREVWEYDNYIEGEQKEMIQLYISRGLSPQDAEQVIHLLSKHKKLFVDLMMKEELELVPIDESISPMMSGVVVTLSCVIFGFLPLLCIQYALYFAQDYLTLSAFNYLYVGISFFLLFGLGIIRTNFNVNSWWRSGLDMVFCGGVVGVAAYTMGGWITL